MKKVRRNKAKNMRDGYVSAIAMTVILGLAVYAVIHITVKVKSWFK